MGDDGPEEEDDEGTLGGVFWKVVNNDLADFRIEYLAPLSLGSSTKKDYRERLRRRYGRPPFIAHLKAGQLLGTRSVKRGHLDTLGDPRKP